MVRKSTSNRKLVKRLLPHLFSKGQDNGMTTHRLFGGVAWIAFFVQVFVDSGTDLRVFLAGRYGMKGYSKFFVSLVLASTSWLLPSGAHVLFNREY